MNFLAPLSLLWLLPLSAVIVTLYLLRLKRRDITVSSVMLWQTVLQDTQANAPFQKLKRNLLLALQLIIALFLVFCVARPFLWASGLGGKTTALVLDASASMKATDEKGGRFAEAIQKAKTLISQKAPGDAVVIVLGGDKPVALSPLTTDTERLNAALDKAQPADTSGDMREAISFAASLVASRAGAQVTVLTDGAFGRLDEIALGGATLGFVTVGKEKAENVAITAFDVRDAFGGGMARQAFVTVQNFGARAQIVPLEIRANGSLLDAHEITLQPGETKSETFDKVRADAGGIVQARLDIKDNLAADNEATVTLAPRRALKILLVTEGNPFLERVLNTDNRVALDAVAPGSYKTTDSDSHDLTVFDDAAAPQKLSPGRYLFWGKAPSGKETLAPATTTGLDTDQPQILDWSRTHPLMRFVDLANVKIMRARTIAPAPWGQTLAETDNGPLIVAGERNDTKAVYVGFSLLESDMPLRVAFPIFLSNCVQWLTARPGDGGGVTRPGEVMALAATPNNGALTIARPDGSKDQLTNTKGSAPLYDKTTEVGVYTATGKNFEQTFAVSLLSASESNIRPVPRPVVVVTDAPDPKEGKASTLRQGTVVRREVWQWLAIAALCVLCAEWFAYHRRLG
jgi:Ca-activated chloride channel family protein